MFPVPLQGLQRVGRQLPPEVSLKGGGVEGVLVAFHGPATPQIAALESGDANAYADQEYPVVWLLHGRASSSTSYRNVDNIGAFMDDRINSGKIVEMVVIMLDSGKYAFYQDSERTPGDKDNSGPWRTQLTTELCGEVQENYRVLTDAKFNGLQDGTVGTSGTIAVHDYLEKVNKTHGYDLRNGGHNSAFYMSGMPASMKMHSDHFLANGLLEEDAPDTGSGVTKYSITVDEMENGTVTVSPERAAKGKEVTLTVVPDAGYELGSLVVKDPKGKEIEVTEENGIPLSCPTPRSLWRRSLFWLTPTRPAPPRSLMTWIPMPGSTRR